MSYSIIGLDDCTDLRLGGVKPLAIASGCIYGEGNIILMVVPRDKALDLMSYGSMQLLLNARMAEYESLTDIYSDFDIRTHIVVHISPGKVVVAEQEDGVNRLL